MSDSPDKPQESPADQPDPRIGSIEWCDITVDDASRLSRFYCSVVGWKSQEVSMGSYDDYNIVKPGGNETVAGICHARGSNSNLPAQWLMYVRVENVRVSSDECTRLGGKVLDGPRRMSGQNFCVIEDPEGAVLALMSD